MTVKVDRYALVVLALLAITVGLIGATVLSSSGVLNFFGLILTVAILIGILVVSLLIGLT